MADNLTVPLFSSRVAHALLSQSPRHAWTQHETLNPDYVPEESDAFDLGKGFHSLVLENKGAFLIIDAPDFRTKAAKEQRDAARAEGRSPILAHRWAEVRAMEAAVRAQLPAIEPPIPFTNGVAEQSIFWEEDGVACRATPDWLHSDHQTIDDLKTTSASAHPAAFSRTLWDKGYDLQAALYLRAVKYIFGIRADFRFIVVETEPPYAVSVVALDPEALAFANTKLDRALAIWAECRRTGDWPAYPTRTCYAEAPAYVQAQFLERSYYDAVLVQASEKV